MSGTAPLLLKSSTQPLPWAFLWNLLGLSPTHGWGSPEQGQYISPVLSNWVSNLLLGVERSYRSNQVDLNTINPKGVPASVGAREWTWEMKQRTRYACCYLSLPKTLHCSMASVMHTVSCVIFSFIFYDAKVIAHRRTTVALPDSFLSASFIYHSGHFSVYCKVALKLHHLCSVSFPANSVGSSHSILTRGNSDFCCCSEAGRHPSLTIFHLKTPTALSLLSQPTPHESAKVITENISTRWHPSVTWVLKTILVFLFLLTAFPFHSPKQLEADISPVLAQHLHKARRKV